MAGADRIDVVATHQGEVTQLVFFADRISLDGVRVVDG